MHKFSLGQDLRGIITVAIKGEIFKLFQLFIALTYTMSLISTYSEVKEAG
jgi:hypothetical protein